MANLNSVVCGCMMKSSRTCANKATFCIALQDGSSKYSCGIAKHKMLLISSNRENIISSPKDEPVHEPVRKKRHGLLSAIRSRIPKILGFTKNSLNHLLIFSIDETTRAIESGNVDVNKILLKVASRVGKAYIASLALSKVMEKNDVCTICLNNIDNHQSTIDLPCGHVFHDDCISKCVASGVNSCPNCRKVFKVA